MTTCEDDQLEKVGQGTSNMQRNAVRFAVMPPKGPSHTSEMIMDSLNSKKRYQSTEALFVDLHTCVAGTNPLSHVLW